MGARRAGSERLMRCAGALCTLLLCSLLLGNQLMRGRSDQDRATGRAGSPFVPAPRPCVPVDADLCAFLGEEAQANPCAHSAAPLCLVREPYWPRWQTARGCAAQLLG